MQQIRISPVQTHVRRQAAASPEDLRWHLLNLVRDCRQALELRDRDVAVLRGLLSLMPAEARADQRVIFASNRVLAERCDGIEERTLRRRLVHLETRGLIRRHLSPNGKRYQLRGGDEVVTYGIDLSPLFAMETHLGALSETAARNALRIKTLRALIRDWLFHHAGAAPALLEEARLSLRRVLCVDKLQALLSDLRGLGPAMAVEMSGSDSQIVRHIQNSDKDYLDSDCDEQVATPEDLTVEECLELAPVAADMCPSRPRCWADIVALACLLAPAIGLGSEALRRAEARMGRHGCALAVLGLVQSFGRIRKPEAYLAALAKNTSATGTNLVRMFRSLVSPCAA